MKILHMMIGLPRSGKSTAAREMGYPIVSHDAISLALVGQLWRPEAEAVIWATARTMVEALFHAGHDDVIIDACNHTEERRRIWCYPEWMIQYHVVSTEAAICIERAMEASRPDLVPVIERMDRDWDPLGGKTDC